MGSYQTRRVSLVSLHNMNKDEFIKKLASLLNEDTDFHDDDLFGNELETPSQVISQVFMGGGWDFAMPIEMALATIDSLGETHQRHHDPIPPDALEDAKTLVKQFYTNWQSAGHVDIKTIVDPSSL